MNIVSEKLSGDLRFITHNKDKDSSISAYIIKRCDTDKAENIPALNDTHSIYFLVGTNDEFGVPTIYVGQTQGQPAYMRLIQHSRNSNENYFEFWKRAIIFVNDGASWDDTDINKLEAILYYLANEYKIKSGYQVNNSKIPSKTHLDNYKQSNTNSLHRSGIDHVEVIINILEDIGVEAYSDYLREQYNQAVEIIKSNTRASSRVRAKQIEEQNKRFAKFPEIDTPIDTVNAMVDLVFAQLKEDISSKKLYFRDNNGNIQLNMDGTPKIKDLKDVVFLDIDCKRHCEFLIAIYKRLEKELDGQFASEYAMREHIIHKQLYGLCIRPSTALESQTILPGKNDKTGEYNIQYIDNYIDLIKGNRRYSLYDNTKSKNSVLYREILGRKDVDGKNGVFSGMNFDVVIGNPPYQDNLGIDGGNKSLSRQLFPYFIYKAHELTSKYMCLIVPSRYYAGDAQDKSFIKLREWMNANNHFRYMKHIKNARSIFDCEIKGGVNYFLYDKEYTGLTDFEIEDEKGTHKSLRPLFYDNIDIIIADEADCNIVLSMNITPGTSLTNISTGTNPFGIFSKQEVVEGVFLNSHEDQSVELRCKENMTLQIDKKFVEKSLDLLESYKVFVSKSAGSPLSDTNVIGIPYIGKPMTACTESLIAIGKFKTLEEAEALQKYLMTKFARYLISIAKCSQNTCQIVYRFVPNQVFDIHSNKCDIDWTKPISEIDKQLFKKYKLDSLVVAEKDGRAITASEYISTKMFDFKIKVTKDCGDGQSVYNT